MFTRVLSAVGVSLLAIMTTNALPLPVPERGFVSIEPATTWEESP